MKTTINHHWTEKSRPSKYQTGMYASSSIFRYFYYVFTWTKKFVKIHLCVSMYKELLITGSEFPLSGFFLAVVCTVKPWEQSRKKIGAKKFPILHYIMPPVWTIVIDKGNLIFLHNRHIFVIC